MESIKVKDYMNSRPVSFKPNMSLSNALGKMLKTQQSGGPVVDETNHVVGFLSEQDMIHKLLKAGYYCQDSDTVADCMHSEVLSVGPEDSIIALAEAMAPAKPKVYPVCDSHGRLIGIISRRDVLRAIGAQIGDGFLHPV